MEKESEKRDFPRGALVKKPPANAGDTGSSPGTGRSHMRQSNRAASHNYWSPRATTTEAHVPQLLKPMCLESVLRNKRSPRNEKHVHHNEE